MSLHILVVENAVDHVFYRLGALSGLRLPKAGPPYVPKLLSGVEHGMEGEESDPRALTCCYVGDMCVSPSLSFTAVRVG